MKKLLYFLILILFVFVPYQTFASQATQVSFLLSGLHDSNGSPLAGAKVYTYVAGTTATAKTCWTDANEVSAATNPVTLDTNGQYQLYCNGWYKFVVKDSTGVTINTWDNLWLSAWNPLPTTATEVRTSAYPDLTTAAAAIGANPMVLVCDSSIDVTADVSTNVNTQIVTEPACSFNISTGKTLTINGSFEAGLYQVFNCTGAGKVVFGAGSVKEVYPDWWATNTTPGTTDMTAAITASIATKRNVKFLNTIYGHTGGLATNNQGQIISGASPISVASYAAYNGTILKKLSGTLTGFSMNSQYGTLEDITFDNNDLAGVALKCTGHHMIVRNIGLDNTATPDFALWLESINLSYFEKIRFGENNYGNLLSSCTYPDQNLYSEFHNITMGTVLGPIAISLSQINQCSFYDMYFEGQLFIGDNTTKLDFYSLKSETLLTASSLIDIDSATARWINFYGLKTTVSADMVSPLINIHDASNVSFINHAHLDQNSTAGTVYYIDTVKGLDIKNSSMFITNNFAAIKSNNAGGYSECVVVNGLYSTYSGGGTNTFMTKGLDIKNSNMNNAFYASAQTYVNMSDITGTINTANILAATPVIITACTGTITDANNHAIITPPAIEQISSAGALSVSKSYSYLTTAAGAMAITLADGVYRGQQKFIVLGVDAGDATLTVAKHRTSSPEVFVFDTAGDSLILMWEGNVWITIENNGVTVP
jgi:hypothetical protein